MKNPFIVGSWVRGEHFFGRNKIIKEILEGSQNAFWVAGTRRLGKTSLLKQLEFLTEQEPYASQYISLFWDLEGSCDLQGLSNSLLESIEDAEQRFENIGICCDELDGKDVFEIFRILRRRVKQENLKLLILCDETEELITIGKNNPDVLPKLRRVFQQGETILTVITATKRLSELERELIPDTSPFLHGFIPPIYLTHLNDQEAEKLIRRGNFDDYAVKEIKDKTDNHPYLMQLICKRLFEAADLDSVIKEISADEMVSHFFEVDFKYLFDNEREILWHIFLEDVISLTELEMKISLPREKLINLLFSLLQLGYIKQKNSHYSVSNYFFQNWLLREQDRLFENLATRPQKALVPSETKAHGIRKELAIGDTISRYRVLEEIGRGGMGVVYKAQDTKLERTVALKVLNPEAVEDEQNLKRFVREAKTASSLNHPNITTIYEFDEVEGIHFISMEYISGETLSEMLKKGPLLIKDTLNFACQIGDGLSNAHRNNVIHRDIKPGNIKVNDEGIVKIMDFGIAKIMDRHTINRTKGTLGTLAYMSPEQASQGEIDHRSDIFSFGIVLYEMVTGKIPFTGEYELAILYSIINETPVPITEINPDAPTGLKQIVCKALEKQKQNRYQNMDEMLNELRKF